MAIRSFLTRPSITAVEFQYDGGNPFVQPCGGAEFLDPPGSRAVNYRFREIGYGNNDVTTIPYTGDALCPLFNCIPGVGSNWPIDTPVRVLRGMCRLTVRIAPQDVNVWGYSDPTSYAGLNPRLPQRLVVRIIGVRCYNDVLNGVQTPVNLPAYTFAEDSTYNSDPDLNLLNCSDVWKSKGPEHWVSARAYDYTDPHTAERTKNKRIVFDTSFVLRNPRHMVASTTQGALQTADPSASREFGVVQKTINIQFPPHTLRGTSVTANADRESSWKFFFAVYQPGTMCNTDIAANYIPGTEPIGQTHIQFDAKSKFWYHVVSKNIV
jgi:hypothetical protein